MAIAMRRGSRTQRRGGRRGARLRGAVGWLISLCGLAVALAVVLAPLLGIERYVITGGSMGEAVPIGSIAFEEVVPTEELVEGDVITYQPPAESGEEGLVTHRIVAMRERDGATVLRTKGDANLSPDPWRFELGAPTQGRVLFSVPLVGYAIGALGDREVRIALIGFPALLIAISAVRRLWRESSAPDGKPEPL
ncbi:signal peptidase I [Thermoleophilia bacterium SCSIO 60948]|nr:signal peptidase I [Thermoleophilia bacterium SCSIO 60948]